MIDLIAMLCCVSGFGLLSFGWKKVGFALSLLGSAFWLLFALSVQSNSLMIQSVLFLIFSTVGFIRDDSRSAR